MATVPTAPGTPTTPATMHGQSGPDLPAPQTGPGGHIGGVVAGSLVVGLVAGLLLAFVPVLPAQEPRLTGALLCGFALGWAMLAVSSVRFTDQPQRWAAVPAVFMGVGGLLLLVFGSWATGVLSWVWPPALLAVVVWMVLRARRDLHSRSGRLLVYPVLGVLALAAVGGVYQVLGAAADARAYPMPGQLVEVGGHRLHLQCTGSGSPTVVAQPGGSEMSSNWAWVAPAVARTTRVCVYDRAGRGWSEPADTAQHAERISADLHTLLQRANVPGPYVVAGHSFGGLYALTFAARYPDDVAGMVLVDSTAPAPAATPTSPDSASSYDVLGRASALLSGSARVGLTRLYAMTEAGTLPPRSRGEVRASMATTEGVRSTIDEYVQASASARQAASLTDLADTPLVVLTAGVGNAPDWFAKQESLAALSTNTSHRTVEGAAHAEMVANQADAATTTQAILDVVAAVRSNEPLAE